MPNLNHKYNVNINNQRQMSFRSLWKGLSYKKSQSKLSAIIIIYLISILFLKLQRICNPITYEKYCKSI